LTEECLVKMLEHFQINTGPFCFHFRLLFTDGRTEEILLLAAQTFRKVGRTEVHVMLECETRLQNYQVINDLRKIIY